MFSFLLGCGHLNPHIRQRLAIKKSQPAGDITETLEFDATQAAEAYKSPPEACMSSPPKDLSRSLAAEFATASDVNEEFSAGLTLNHILAVFFGIFVYKVTITRAACMVKVSNLIYKWLFLTWWL